MKACQCVNVDFDCGCDGFCSVRLARARKPHRCDECGDEIAIGQSYELNSGRWEVAWYRHRTCGVCQEIRAAFFSCGFLLGMVWEDLKEHIQAFDGEVDAECLVGLSPAARERVCEIIEDVWERIEKGE